MVKLPTYEDLAGGGPRATRQSASADTGAGAIGAATSKLGRIAVGIADENQRENDALDALRADAFHKVGMMETERQFDTDPDYQSYDQKFAPSAQGITNEAASMIRNPAVREKWMLKANVDNEGYRNRILDRGTRLAREQKVVDVENVLDQYRATYDQNLDDPDRSDKAISDMDNAITASEKTGLVDPSTAATLRRKHLGGAVIDGYEAQILKDPESVIKELEGFRDVTPNASGPEFKTRRGDTMRTITSPGGAKVTVNANYADRFAGLLADLERNGVSINQTETGGYNDRNIRGSSKLSNHAHGTAVDVNWNENARGSRGNIDPELARSIASKWGAEWGGDWKNPDPMHFEITPKSSAGWKPSEDANTLPKRVAQGTTSATDAVEVSDIPPVTRGRAYLLNSEQRKSVLDKARVAYGAVLSDQVNKDIIRIKAGLDPEVGPDGMTSIERIERGMKAGAKAENLRIKWDRAIKERDAIAPMERMSDDEALAHIANLKESPWLQKAASDSWKKQMKLRDEDPASVVVGDNDVRTAGEIATKRAASVGLKLDGDGNLTMEDMPGSIDPDTKQAAIGTILEARLQAQQSRGMPDYATRIITRREAKNLLQIDSPTGMDDRKYRAALEQAAQRALDWYGPEYGKRALEEAIGFQRGSRTNDKKRFEDKLLAGIAAGDGVSQSDMRKYNELSRTTGMMSREFELQDPTAVDDARPYIGQPLQPSPAHVDWLKNNISDPGSIAAFDAKFGQGAAARALAAGQDAKTTRDMNLPAPVQPKKSILQQLFGN